MEEKIEQHNTSWMKQQLEMHSFPLGKYEKGWNWCDLLCICLNKHYCTTNTTLYNHCICRFLHLRFRGEHVIILCSLVGHQRQHIKRYQLLSQGSCWPLHDFNPTLGLFSIVCIKQRGYGAALWAGGRSQAFNTERDYTACKNWGGKVIPNGTNDGALKSGMIPCLLSLHDSFSNYCWLCALNRL